MAQPSDNSEASKASEEGERPEAEGAKAPGAETGSEATRHRHPAKYSEELLPLLRHWLEGKSRVLDPFGGIGTGNLAQFYNELEFEWVEQCGGLRVQGDATRLTFKSESFDAVVTSPVYGNRMSDHFEARDSSHRITYRHYLGKPLRPNNAGKLHYPHAGYKRLHLKAWQEVWRVLEKDGLFILNVGDFNVGNIQQKVSAWHVDRCIEIGFHVLDARKVWCPGMRQGANGKNRVPYQNVYKMVKEENG